MLCKKPAIHRSWRCAWHNFSAMFSFYTDPRKVDSFRIILEKKKYSNGLTAGYGRILAA
jgi:hypothetical protein